MVGLRKQKWEETVQNAQNSLAKRLCYYIDPDTDMTVVFSFIDQVLGVVSSSQYINMEKLPHNDKENARKLAIRALNDWDNVHFANDVDSILDSMNLSISMEQENPAELKLEDLDIICSFSDTHIAASGNLSSDNYELSMLDVVSQEQPPAPYLDHISTTNASVDLTFCQGSEHPNKCLEIAPFVTHERRGDNGFDQTSGMNLSNKHDMVMPKVTCQFPEFNIKELFGGTASSPSTSSSNLIVPPLWPQEEAIANFRHWNNIQLDTLMADQLLPVVMENHHRSASSSTNMALVRTISWRTWLKVAYVLSVRWGLLRTDTITLAKIEDWLTRWRMVQVNVVHSLDDLSFLEVAFKFKKPRTQ
ncbi:hypothetical protein Leryth_022235 [Lithospermum erythrorhizon]|nr:hypothetical protein Leryth_022235 [Lithospermum erythrorhizon]